MGSRCSRHAWCKERGVATRINRKRDWWWYEWNSIRQFPITKFWCEPVNQSRNCNERRIKNKEGRKDKRKVEDSIKTREVWHLIHSIKRERKPRQTTINPETKTKERDGVKKEESWWRKSQGGKEKEGITGA